MSVGQKLLGKRMVVYSMQLVSFNKKSQHTSHATLYTDTLLYTVQAIVSTGFCRTTFCKVGRYIIHCGNKIKDYMWKSDAFTRHPLNLNSLWCNKTVLNSSVVLFLLYNL